MEISGELGTGELLIDSRRLQAPYRIDGHRILDGKVVILVDSSSLDRHEDSDFDLPEPGRNILALDSTGDVVWTVSEAPPETDSADTNRYVYLFTVMGDLYARDVDKQISEIDPNDGRVTQSFDSSILPLGDERIHLAGWIVKVVEFEDHVIVGCAGPDHHTLYGFDTDGTQLWKADERRGTVFWDGEVLIEKVELGPRTWNFYRLDPDNGARIEEIEVENTGSGWKCVGDVSDSN